MEMALFDSKMSTIELLKLAAQAHQKQVQMDENERSALVALLKERGADELEYGQEVEVDKVRLVRRVNGAIGIYYS